MTPRRLLALATFALATTCIAEPLVFAQASAGDQPRGGDRAGRQPRDRQDGRGGGGGGGGGGDRGGGFGGGGFMGGMLGGGPRSFELPVTEDDMSRYAAMVNLSADQKTAVDALYTAFRQSFEDSASTTRTKVDDLREQMRESRDFSLMQQIGDETNKFRTKSQEMETSFFSDVKAVLTPEQTTKWTSVEQTHRRERSVGRGIMSGERVDLVRVVDDLKLAPDAKAKVQSVLDQYASDLDRELIQRNKVQDEAQTKGRALMTNFDPAAMQKLIEDGRASALKVRDVNTRYARQVEALLPEDKHAAFETAYKKQAYPVVYRTTNAQRVIDAAGAMSDLTPEQKSSLEAIKSGFDRELSAVSTKLETAYSKREETWNPADALKNVNADSGFRAFGQVFRSFETDEMRDLQEQRRTLDDTTTDKVKAILTPEQQAKLPERPQGRGRGGDAENAPAGGNGGGAGGGGGADRPRDRRRNNQPPAPPANPKV